MEPGSNKAVARKTSKGWSTRQLKAALVVVVVIAVAAFFALRDKAADAPTPAGPPADHGAGPDARLTEPPPVAAEAPTRSRSAGRYDFADAAITDVESGLAAADAALQAGRLYQPQGDNAIRLYLAVLRLEPGNEAAEEGLAAVSARLVQRMEDALVQRDLEQAAEIGDVLLAAFPEQERYRDLVERLDSYVRAEDFLMAARDDVQAGRLVEPAGSNALARLQRARELDPERKSIAVALDRLQGQLIDEAISAARQSRFPEAERWLRHATAIEQNTRVSDAENRIERFRSQRVQSHSAAIRTAIRGAEFSRAQALIGELEELGARTDDLQPLRGELAHARIYGNFAVGQIFADPLPIATGPAMVVLPHGSFLMGSPPGEDGHRSAEEPRHRVHFSRGFALGQSEIRTQEFQQFIEATGYRTDAEREGYSYVYNPSNGRIIRRSGVNWRHDYTGRRTTPETPVVHVSWNDAHAYARWLAEQSGQPYRLASEAEFEYGQRAGGNEAFWWGYDSPQAVVENLTGENDRSPRTRRTWNQAFENYGDGHWGPAPVRSFEPNAFGLYDMAGNVQEWVTDCWHDSYVRAPVDGSAWVNIGCDRRVVRGGFWGGAPVTARSAYRAHHPAEQRGSAIGFRVARDLY